MQFTKTFIKIRNKNISRILQEMSLSELEQSITYVNLNKHTFYNHLHLQYKKKPYAGLFLSANRSNFIDFEEICYVKKASPLYVFENERIPIFYKNKAHFVDTLSRRISFWYTAVSCGSKNSHNLLQFNPDEDKYYLLTPYPTLMPPLKKFSPENIRTLEAQI